MRQSDDACCAGLATYLAISSGVRGPRSGAAPVARRSASLSSRTSARRRRMMAKGSSSSFTDTCGWQQGVGAEWGVGWGQRDPAPHTPTPAVGSRAPSTSDGRDTAACRQGGGCGSPFLAPTRKPNPGRRERQRGRAGGGQATHLVADHGHALREPAGADALLERAVLRADGGHHDGAAVAAQAVAQHHGHHAVAVGDVAPAARRQRRCSCEQGRGGGHLPGSYDVVRGQAVAWGCMVQVMG